MFKSDTKNKCSPKNQWANPLRSRAHDRIISKANLLAKKLARYVDDANCLEEAEQVTFLAGIVDDRRALLTTVREEPETLVHKELSTSHDFMLAKIPVAILCKMMQTASSSLARRELVHLAFKLAACDMEAAKKSTPRAFNLGFVASCIEDQKSIEMGQMLKQAQCNMVLECCDYLVSEYDRERFIGAMQQLGTSITLVDEKVSQGA